MPIDPVYLCKDCKYSKMDILSYVVSLGGRVGVKDWMYKCKKSDKPAKEVIDMVTGPKIIKPELLYCDVERKHGECGPTARNWQPKHKKDLFKMITKESYD